VEDSPVAIERFVSRVVSFLVTGLLPARGENSESAGFSFEFAFVRLESCDSSHFLIDRASL